MSFLKPPTLEFSAMSTNLANASGGRQPPVQNKMEYHGFSTRQIASGAHLLNGCFHMTMYGRQFHTHTAAYLIRGSHASVLIDTGHAKDGPRIEAFIRSVIGDELTYIFPTHEEYPHAGNLDALLKAFPKAKAVGEVRNYHLYHPGHDQDGRFLQMEAGEKLSLGGRTLTILPGLIHDLPATSWAHDDGSELLFVSDAFAFSHYREDECTLLTDELPSKPTVDDTRMVLDLALSWVRFSDNRGLMESVRRMLRENKTRMICPAHGNVITDVAELTVLMERAFLANGIKSKDIVGHPRP
jgi:flavorubredoxin